MQSLDFVGMIVFDKNVASFSWERKRRGKERKKERKDEQMNKERTKER